METVHDKKKKKRQKNLIQKYKNIDSKIQENTHQFFLILKNEVLLERSVYIQHDWKIWGI